MSLPIKIRQVDGTEDSWQILRPNAATSFFWEDLGRRRRLEVLVDGMEQVKSQTYNIDEISDHPPIKVLKGPVEALNVTVAKEEKVSVVKISDRKQDDSKNTSEKPWPSLSWITANDACQQVSDCEFHVIVELAELGISVVDHTPEEVLYLSVQSLLVGYSTGLGSGISRYDLILLITSCFKEYLIVQIVVHIICIIGY